MSRPEPPEQPVPLGVADAMIDASKSLRTKKKCEQKFLYSLSELQVIFEIGYYLC